MKSFGDFIAEIDIISYLLAVTIVILTVMIVWILLREMRLWYWKSNRTARALNNIQHRMQDLENNLEFISSNLEDISENTSVFKNMEIRMTEEDEANDEDFNQEITEEKSVEEK